MMASGCREKDVRILLQRPSEPPKSLFAKLPLEDVFSETRIHHAAYREVDRTVPRRFMLSYTALSILDVGGLHKNAACCRYPSASGCVVNYAVLAAAAVHPLLADCNAAFLP